MSGAVTPAARNIAGSYVAGVAALAVGDAADYLRNISSASAAVQAVALEQLLATRNPIYGEIIDTAAQTATQAVELLTKVGAAAGKVTTEFG